MPIFQKQHKDYCDNHKNQEDYNIKVQHNLPDFSDHSVYFIIYIIAVYPTQDIYCLTDSI